MKWLILVLTLVFSSVTFSAQQCESEKLYLIFQKGANTYDHDAKEYMKEVRSKIKKLYNDYNLYDHTSLNPYDIEVVIMPNPVQPLIIKKLPQLFKEYFFFEGGDKELTESYKKDLEETFKKEYGENGIYDQQLAIYKAILLGEKNPLYPVTEKYTKGKAIIFAHSQGNMQLHVTMDRFFREYPELDDKYKVMSVGSPITLPNAHGYVMDKYDMLRPLDGYPYNTNNDIPFWKLIMGGSHAFIQYLNGKLRNHDENLIWGSALKIDDFLLDSIIALAPDNSGQDSAFIEVSLEVPKNSNAKLLVSETIATFKDGERVESTVGTTSYNDEYYHYNNSNLKGMGVIKKEIGPYFTDKYIYTSSCNMFAKNPTEEVAVSFLGFSVYYPEKVESSDFQDAINSELVVKTPTGKEIYVSTHLPQKPNYSETHHISGLNINHLVGGDFKYYYY